jgi:hypothetical protein
MKLIISSTSERYGRCGLSFTRSGAEFELLDQDDDKRDATPIGIGRNTYAVLEAEAKRGKLSILPASQAEALASRESASARITALEAELATAKARVAELEAALAKKSEPAKGEGAKK